MVEETALYRLSESGYLTEMFFYFGLGLTYCMCAVTVPNRARTGREVSILNVDRKFL